MPGNSTHDGIWMGTASYGKQWERLKLYVSFKIRTRHTEAVTSPRGLGLQSETRPGALRHSASPGTYLMYPRARCAWHRRSRRVGGHQRSRSQPRCSSEFGHDTPACPKSTSIASPVRSFTNLVFTGPTGQRGRGRSRSSGDALGTSGTAPHHVHLGSCPALRSQSRTVLTSPVPL